MDYRVKLIHDEKEHKIIIDYSDAPDLFKTFDTNIRVLTGSGTDFRKACCQKLHLSNLDLSPDEAYILTFIKWLT